MATYTDFHNRVKENINVDYHNRITPQKVRLLNEENEYWGTLKGKISAENIVINGGELSNVTINNATLTGEVKVGEIDIAKVGKDIDSLHENYNSLNERCTNVESSTALNKTDISKLSTALNNLSNNLSSVNNTVIDSIGTQIDLLSTQNNKLNDNLNTLSSKFLSSVEFNDKLHEQINDKINILSDNYISADNDIINTIENLSISNNKTFETLSNDYISRITRDRHYVINEYKNTYPYKLQDYAINVFNLDVPTTRVTYYDSASSKTYDIGLISTNESSNPFPLIFKPYNNIGFENLRDAFNEDTSYTFNDNNPINTGKNYYKIKVIGNNLSNIKLEVASDYKWYDIVFQNDIIGRITNVQLDENTKFISSGYIDINTDIDELTCFNKFDKTVNSLSSYINSGYKITLNTDNTLTLTKNYKTVNSFTLRDPNKDNKDFGYIYEDDLEYTDGNESISGITVNIYDPINTTDIKLTRNTVSCVLSTHTDNTETILNANFDNKVVDLSVFDCQKLYEYQLSSANTSGDISTCCKLIPNIYNKRIASLSDLLDVESISIDTTNIVDLNSFKNVYVLNKVTDENIWKYELVDDKQNTLNISFSIENNDKNILENTLIISIKSYDSNPDENVNNGVTTYRFTDDISKVTNTLYNIDTWNSLIYKTKIDIDNITWNKKHIGITYTANISGKLNVNDISSFTLDTRSENVDSLKFEIPSKSHKDNYISREFFITAKLNSSNSKYVNIEFVDENGNNLSNNIFYNKQHELKMRTCPADEVSAWTTFMVNEVQNNKYLITDLNDTIDHEKLNDIYSKIENLSIALSDETSARISSDEQLSNEFLNILSDVSSDLSIALSDETSARISSDEQLSNEFLNILSDVSSDLSIALSDETSARISSDEQLSNAIDNKIIINGLLAKSLSTIYLTQEEIEAKANSLSSDVNELYVVSALNKNASSNVISNDAFNKVLATKNYVDISVDNLKNQILSNDNDINSISNDIYLSTGLSAQFVDLSVHYHSTFTEISSNENHPEDVYDALIIPDNTNDAHIKYKLVFSNGTLVLEKIV